jgi:hypothetical protein
MFCSRRSALPMADRDRREEQHELIRAHPPLVEHEEVTICNLTDEKAGTATVLYCRNGDAKTDGGALKMNFAESIASVQQLTIIEPQPCLFFSTRDNASG